jgi:hypothetical protein
MFTEHGTVMLANVFKQRFISPQTTLYLQNCNYWLRKLVGRMDTQLAKLPVE